MANDPQYTASEVKVFEMLTSIQTTQKFILEQLQSLASVQTQHEKAIQSQQVVCEGRRQELTTLTATLAAAQHEIRAHEEFMQQLKGSWRAAIVISSVISALMSAAATAIHTLLSK